MKKKYAIECKFAKHAPGFTRHLAFGHRWTVCRRYEREQDRDEALMALRKKDRGLWTFRKA